ncbi:SH3 domain-containing protein [Pseudooceanicola spongiae]|jgi:hypothetical protein|uniref:SH3 domain-containing protein n=1 Tax=Pseudooceanicola spongiae TaxID=2613965 RepID=A0A7L9WSQ9_9RHOB|nr:SH3 domain-containing protein [Pseudooceanicola spongiae]QOL82466.1 SH3 domain-containing protein [Pseudooceanicola spongiae]|tara:strand:- start:1184 stop:1471 length:288 start_codon:yes stop_codon:yes gene_type:complete
MRRGTLSILFSLMLVAGCSDMGPQRTVVRGAGPDDLLKLRVGPGLHYKVIMGLPDGTALTRRDCVTEVGQLWCRVSLTDSPSVKGYVSADYLARK